LLLSDGYFQMALKVSFGLMKIQYKLHQPGKDRRTFN